MVHSKHLALNHWRQYKRSPLASISTSLAQWLLDTSSLTKRLIEVSKGAFFVRKLQQNWQTPHLSEARLLNLKPSQVALVREVELVCMGQPWVYARSIFPVSTLKGKLRHLKTLGDQPLGSVLFKDPSMKRTVFEIAMLAQQSIDALKHCDSNRSLWGRRSKFFLHKKPVLVTEVFLPPLEQYASKVRL